MDTSGHYIIVEWYDPITGTWGDMGEATSNEAALVRIAGLRAADSEPQRYRIVETTVTEVE